MGESVCKREREKHMDLDTLLLKEAIINVLHELNCVVRAMKVVVMVMLMEEEKEQSGKCYEL